MPSTLADFGNRVKRIDPDLRVGVDYTNQSSFNWVKNNLYRRSITVNNSGKSAKSNYIISFVLETTTIYKANKCGFTCNDFRFFDSDGITPLNYYVEGPNTGYTTFYVSIPSLSATSYTIYVEYGNPALSVGSKSAGFLFSPLGSGSLVGWMKSNEANRLNGGGVVDNQVLAIWQNKKAKKNFARKSGDPILKTGQLNNLPVTRFDGTNDFYTFNSPLSTFNSGVSIFVVWNPSSSVNFARVIDLGNGQASNNILIARVGVSSELGFSVYNGSTNQSVNAPLTITNNSWQLHSVISQTGTNNTKMYKNASTVATGTITTFPTSVTRQFNFISKSNWAVDPLFAGDIAEVLIFDSPLNDSDRDSVHNYLNTKYRLYSTSDMPTITVNSESTLTPDYSFRSFSPLVDFSTEQKIEKDIWGVATGRATANVINVFTKTLAVGNSLESWSDSTLDLSSKLNGTSSRSKLISSTQTIDQLSIERSDSTTNRASISKYDVTNDVISTDYPISDSDFVCLDYFCEDASKIDLANNYLRFENKNLLSYTETYNNSVWNPSGGIVGFTTGQLDPFGTNRATQINFGASQFIFQQYLTGYLLGRQFTFSGYLKGTPGQTITIALSSRDAANVVLESAGFAVTLTTDYQRFSRTITLTATSSTMNKIQVGFSTFPTATASIVTLAFTQLEVGASASNYQARVTNGALSYQASFSSNINTLISNQLNTIKIPLSSFTKTGSDSWSDASYIFKLGRKTTTSTQNIWYGNLRVVKNTSPDVNEFVDNAPLYLANAASSDNGSTFAVQKVLEGRITQGYGSAKDYKININDYLKTVLNLKFSDLPAFPNNFVCFDSIQELDSTGSAVTANGWASFYTSYLKKVLGFVFPNTMLDINCPMIAGSIGSNGDTNYYNLFLDIFEPMSFYNLGYFTILGNEKVGDVLNKLLNPCFGILSYSQATGKITARNGYKIWNDITPSLLDTSYSIQNIIEGSFKNNYNSEDTVLYNSLDMKVYTAELRESGVVIGSSGAGYELKESGKTTLFFEDFNLMSYGEGTLLQILDNFFVGQWFVSSEPNGILNNTNVSVSDYGTFNNKCYVEFNNTNSTKRYLQSLTCYSDCVTYIKYNGFASWRIDERVVLNDKNISDSTSIAKYSEKKYDIDFLYSFVGYSPYDVDYLPPKLYQDFPQKFKNGIRPYEFSVQYDPNLFIGQRVTFADEDNNTKSGWIVDIRQYSDNYGIVSSLRVLSF